MKIKPENQMNPEMLKDFLSPKNTLQKPVIEINPDTIMPLHLFIADFEFHTTNGTTLTTETLNLLLTILHHKKTNTLEIRGRMRYEETQRKTIFSLKTIYTLTELLKAKTDITAFYQTLQQDLPFIPTHQPFTLDFEINEDMETTLEKINQSDYSNIGTAPIAPK